MTWWELSLMSSGTMPYFLRTLVLMYFDRCYSRHSTLVDHAFHELFTLRYINDEYHVIQV